MKSIPLRSLLRDPMKVKRLTRSGQSVQVTENGRPLWIIRPVAEADEAIRAQAIDELLKEALSASSSSVKAAALLEQSRR